MVEIPYVFQQTDLPKQDIQVDQGADFKVPVNFILYSQE